MVGGAKIGHEGESFLQFAANFLCSFIFHRAVMSRGAGCEPECLCAASVMGKKTPRAAFERFGEQMNCFLGVIPFGSQKALPFKRQRAARSELFCPKKISFCFIEAINLEQFIAEPEADFNWRKRPDCERLGRSQIKAEREIDGLNFALHIMAELIFHLNKSGVKSVGEGLFGQLALTEKSGQLGEGCPVRRVIANHEVMAKEP